MTHILNSRLATLVVSLALAAAAAAGAQPPAPPPTTAVLVNLTVKPDVDRAQLATLMPEEVRDTVKLYLDGKIQQWYARGDGRGVVFILNVTDAATAKALMDSLPLAKSNLVTYEYTALGPLTPLRALITRPGASSERENPPAPAPASPPVFAGSPQYPLLPRALEIELALSAAPTHLRDQATVWTLEQSGYAVARRGTNAFACIVSRRAGDLFPVCWDAEGTRSLLPVDVDDARMRLAGTPGAQIEATIAERFKNGQYHAPARAGVAYMLSPMRYRIDDHGVVSRTVSNPHLMFYAPNLTDADIGGVRGAFAFVNHVGPDGMIIVPVGQVERDHIVTESRTLVERVEHALGYRQP